MNHLRLVYNSVTQALPQLGSGSPLSLGGGSLLPLGSGGPLPRLQGSRAMCRDA